MKRSIEIVVMFLLIGGIWACGGGHKNTAIVTPAKAPVKSAAPAKSSPIDQVIAQAREHYFIGERELNLGHLDKAKEEFDKSLDVLMSYQSQHEPDQKIEAVIDELENKIFQHEMAALKEGDGFSERPLEPALVDELKSISTFPPPDQETKQEVEQELKTVMYDLPVEVNDAVLSFIRIWQNSRRKEFLGGLVRSGRYIDRMKEIFREEGMPEDLVYMALIESSFKSNAYSRARAKGFWQFIAGTAKRYDLKMDWWVDERSDFERSTRAAARYLKWLYGWFNDWYLAMAAYNAGENKIAYGIRNTGATNFWDLARTRYIRQETKNYVPAILAGMIIAKDPIKYGFTETLEDPIKFDAISIDYTVDLRLVAECSGVSVEEIKQLNPELVRMTTPARSSYELRVPAGKKDTFLAEISSIPEEKRITWRKHEVKPGETLSSIAAIYRTSATSISAANSFQSDMTLSPGQKVVIPIGRSSVSFPPSTSSASGGTTYRVRKGDTLFRIAAKNGTSVERICELNGISSRHSLRVGERLIVRSGSSTRTSSSKSSSSKKIASTSSSKNKKIIYQVKRGDTLFAIASSFKTDVNSIKKWNGLANHSIHPGDSLTIYTK